MWLRFQNGKSLKVMYQKLIVRKVNVSKLIFGKADISKLIFGKLDEANCFSDYEKDGIFGHFPDIFEKA